MNVYFMGGEDIDFASAGSVILNQTGFGNPSYCRVQLEVPSGSTTWPMTASVSNPVSFGNRSLLWVHAQFFPFNSTNTTASNIMLALADNAGVGRLMVRGTGTAGQLKISTRNAAGTFTDVATTAAGAFVTPAVTVAFDLFVNYSTTGQATLYLNGVNVADTGTSFNVTTDSATSLSYVYFGAAGASDYIWSEIIVADSDTRAAHLLLLNSNTAGNAQQWTGTATGVNEGAINDATFISAASAGLIQEYQTGGVPSGTFTVPAVKMIARALIGSSGPQQLEYVTRVGSTDYVGGSWVPTVGSFGNDTQSYMQAINPGTGIAWTTADLAASTFNYGVESLTVAVTITNIGTASISNPATAVSVGSAISIGTLVVVLVSDFNTTLATATVTDSKGNSYSRPTPIENVNSVGNALIFYSFITVALTTSDTITYTGTGSGFGAITVVSATGFSAIDTATTHTASGFTTTWSVTGAGSAAVPNEINFGIGCVNGSPSITGNGTPLNIASGAAGFMYAGYIINAGTSAQTFTGAVTTNWWVAAIVSFRP